MKRPSRERPHLRPHESSTHDLNHRPPRAQRSPTTCRALRRAQTVALALPALAFACAVDGEPERLGFTDDPLAATPPSAVVARPVDFVGRWRGSAPDLLELALDADGAPLPYEFPSGSSDFTLEIGVESDFALQPSLTFGAAPAPEATDPMLSYPPGAAFGEYVSNPPALEGAQYDLWYVPFGLFEAEPRSIWDDRALADAGGVLRLYYATADAYEAWCPLQPSLPVGTDGEAYNCLGARGVARAVGGGCYTYDDESTAFYPPGAGEGIIPAPAREVDCARAFACLEQCACPDPESGDLCVARNGYVGELWLRRAGDELIGVFAGDATFFNPRGGRTQIGQVRFQRSPDSLSAR